MIDSPLLLADLKRELKALEADLRARAEDASTPWGKRLRDEYDAAKRRERTGLAWIDWRDGEVSQAAVAWIIASVFIRFAEDNGLLAGAQRDARPVALPWIAAPGDGLDRAVENEQAFYATSPTATSRDWLQDAFRTLADLPAGRPLVDPDHSAVWHAPVSAAASDALLAFFRRTTPGGELVHDFSDPDLGTRFLGDLYQDLSDYAKKTYALLQTPVFVEEFILDLTLTPAIAEFGLTGLKLIDPTCGSGHFLLGAFDRLVQAWAAIAPNVEVGERVQRALDSIHGVDLNPFAAAIARFRLTVAAIKAAGIKTLVAAPAFRYHLAIGDSLLGGQSVQLGFDFGDGEEFEYSVEDLQQHADILRPGQYHVVVGNPPYISVADPILREKYRARYTTCTGLWTLVVPFMELFFRLAVPGDHGGSGHVGQITSNNFMKRSFGRGLVNNFLSGNGVDTRVDLTHIVDTSGAYIPGHSTPTVILIGRRRRPTSSMIRAVLGVRGEPSTPPVAADGRVWREIAGHVTDTAFRGDFVMVSDEPRQRFAHHPWSLASGDSDALQQILEESAELRPNKVSVRIGYFGDTHADDAFVTTWSVVRRLGDASSFRRLVAGNAVRDYVLQDRTPVFFPYDADHQLRRPDELERSLRWLWPLRTELGARKTFGGESYAKSGRAWYAWHQLPPDVDTSPVSVAYAEIASHNHFFMDRDGLAFARTAPIIKFPSSFAEARIATMAAVLNSSTAAFWIRQVAYKKGGSEEAWGDRFQLNGSSLADFPLPGGIAHSVVDALFATQRDLQTLAPFEVGPREGFATLRVPSTRDAWEVARTRLVALQEEVDWQVYAAYGLVDGALAPADPEIVPIEPNERPFEVRLGRALGDGNVQSAWFDRHGRTPLTVAPAKGSQAWRDLWQARYDAAESGFIKMLERPEYKRRWAGATWGQLVADAAVEALLDWLEAPELWLDARGVPVVRSVAQVADGLRHDERFRELLAIHTGTQDYDLTAEVGKLLTDDAVPALAALRYKAPGIEKFRAWERTWELQRAEDRGERVEVPVPPKYAQADFLKASYWSARGKLDVPKERFISFPGSKLVDDATELYGWAGWDHGERGQAIARLANDLSRAGAPDEQVIPLVGALIEIEPWLKQWHDELDARTGVSPATAVAGITTTLLGRLGLGRDAVTAWRPAAPARGRRSAS